MRLSRSIITSIKGSDVCTINFGFQIILIFKKHNETRMNLSCFIISKITWFVKKVIRNVFEYNENTIMVFNGDHSKYRLLLSVK